MMGVRGIYFKGGSAPVRPDFLQVIAVEDNLPNETD